jgi:hypothetical protein
LRELNRTDRRQTHRTDCEGPIAPTRGPPHYSVPRSART